MKSKIEIDVFEASALIRSFWGVKTILGHALLCKAVNWYLLFDNQERMVIWRALQGFDEPKSVIQHRLLARYNPKNQYILLVSDNVKDVEVQCYFFEDKYWADESRFVHDSRVKHIKQLSNEKNLCEGVEVRYDAKGA